MYIILSKREEIYYVLQVGEIANIDDIKFISFKSTKTEDKARVLHINKVNNTPVKFESLCELNVKKETIYQGERENLRTTLMGIKHNNTLLFVGVEQGRGVP